MTGPHASRPTAVDLTPELRAVQDQGPRGTCLAFSVTAAHEHARVRAGKSDEDLSVEFLFWAAKQVDGDDDDSTIFESAEQALVQTGQPRDALWPYDGQRRLTHAGYGPPRAALIKGELHRASLRQVGTTLDDLRHELADRQIVAIGFELWDAFYRPVGGEVATPAAHELIGDYHAVALVGYDDGKSRIFIRNSWGERWWTRGMVALGYDFVNNGGVIAAWVVDGPI